MDSRRKELLRYALPAILTNACIFLFTIVDGVFVGRGIGSDALGAVNIALPLVMIAMAVNMLTCIGGVTVAAIRFGRGDTAGANQAFMHSLVLTFLFSSIVTAACLCCTELLARLLGADESYLAMVKDYVFWWGLFAVPSALSLNLQSFCRNDGSPGLVAVSTALSTALNIFLDWLFVFPMGMGIMGAALATGLSQTVAMCIVLAHFALKKGRLRIARFKSEGALYRKVLFRGLPEMIAQFAAPVTTICMNHMLLAHFGGIGVNSYSIISYVSSLAMSVLAGASEGLQPLFGQAYGGKRGEDLNYYFRMGMLTCLVGSGATLLLSVLLNRQICILFGADSPTIEFTVKHLPQYAWAFLPAGVNTLISAYLYSTKRSAPAIALNVLRSFVCNTLSITLLPAILGGDTVWFTFGIAECLVMAAAWFLKRRSEKGGVIYR